MALKLFNTLSRSVQEFAPLDPNGKNVGMYCCGPTVYDFAHIGNWRTFVFADLVRRYLEFKNYEIRHVMNITDVEDKIIKGVRESKTTLNEFTLKYETAFLEDLEELNCKKPTVMPRATEHIAEIILLIEKLLARGMAYKTADGSVYFSIEKYCEHGCNYGQLANLNFDEMRPGERVTTDEYAKDKLVDFALWKARVPDDGDVFWKSDSLGEGRPGWHIECSAMSMKALGESFDLHLGGEDLKFPHHEDEIAQSEGATGKQFVKYWLHGAFLLVEGKKMSKSFGNFYTLRDLLAKGFSGREVRYLLLTAHYRETFNFTLEGLQGAQAALGRIEECLKKLIEFGDMVMGSVSVVPDAIIIKQFEAALDDDLNVSKAWGVIFNWVRALNRSISKGNFSPEQANIAIATWKRLDNVLGLNFRPRSDKRIMLAPQGMLRTGSAIDIAGESNVPDEVIDLAWQRLKAKEEKNFKLADALRNKIKSLGYLVEDTPNGSKLKKL